MWTHAAEAFMQRPNRMTKREVHIVSYFSLPTDLAGSMRDWAAFRGGEEYSVDLQSIDGESVTVRLDSGDDQHVAVSAPAKDISSIACLAVSSTSSARTATT